MVHYTVLTNPSCLRGIAGIYCIRNTKNDKTYVGRSADIGDRLRGHLTTLRMNKHHSKLLQAEFIQYGAQEFDCCVLEAMDRKTYLGKNDLVDTLEFIWTMLLQAEYGGARPCLLSRKIRQRQQTIIRRQNQVKHQINDLRHRLRGFRQELIVLNSERKLLNYWLEKRQAYASLESQPAPIFPEQHSILP